MNVKAALHEMVERLEDEDLPEAAERLAPLVNSRRSLNGVGRRDDSDPEATVDPSSTQTRTRPTIDLD